MNPKERLIYAFSPENTARIKARRVLRECILKELQGRVWHSTIPERYERILLSGFILPEPEILDSERWSTLGGGESYPYVRTLGGVSLFDFTDFDPESYSERCPTSNWTAFVPFLEDRKCAVWIEIDHEQLADSFISGKKLLERWDSEVGRKPKLMPYLEAAHIGPIPRTAFKRAFLVKEGGTDFFPLTG